MEGTMTSSKAPLSGAGELSLLAIPAAGLVTILAQCGAGWAVTNVAFALFMAACMYLRDLHRRLAALGCAKAATVYGLIATVALFAAATGPSLGAQNILIAPSRAVGFPWPGSDAGIVFTLPIWILSVWLLILLSLGLAKFAAALRTLGAKSGTQY